VGLSLRIVPAPGNSGGASSTLSALLTFTLALLILARGIRLKILKHLFKNVNIGPSNNLFCSLSAWLHWYRSLFPSILGKSARQHVVWSFGVCAGCYWLEPICCPP
jgi:hypothetical protein